MHASPPTVDVGGGAGLDRLLGASEVVLTCGAGGVGKTSVAAALGAMAATHLDARVLVLTIDPARRLAGAMGLSGFGNDETRVLSGPFAGAGARGELWAAMLDTKASWDDLVRRHAPDDATRAAILANPLYRDIAATFVQSHDYIAMERLHELHASGRFDLIVVDTPPSRHAIDFLDAPARMAEFFSSRLLRWLIAPRRSRLVNLASRPFHVVADRLLGPSFLTDITEFFLLLQSMYPGFVARARMVEQTLADPRTAFVVVTTLEEGPVAEAVYFGEELQRRGLMLGAVVCNRVLPATLGDAGARRLAARFERDPGEVAAALAAAVPARTAAAVPVALLEQVLAGSGETFGRYALAARREADLAARLAFFGRPTAFVGQLDHDVADLTHLLELGGALWSA